MEQSLQRKRAKTQNNSHPQQMREIMKKAKGIFES
jgi:hypothetical protein